MLLTKNKPQQTRKKERQWRAQQPSLRVLGRTTHLPQALAGVSLLLGCLLVGPLKGVCRDYIGSLLQG